jgi:hypothetical protein
MFNFVIAASVAERPIYFLYFICSMMIIIGCAIARWVKYAKQYIDFAIERKLQDNKLIPDDKK